MPHMTTTMRKMQSLSCDTGIKLLHCKVEEKLDEKKSFPLCRLVLEDDVVAKTWCGWLEPVGVQRFLKSFFRLRVMCLT